MEVIGGIEWLRWQYRTPEGFLLTGLRTVPRGLPVLHFIHGNSYSGLTYLPLWQQLANDYDIFLHDAQGHGDSEHGGRFVGWQRSSELAETVWRQFRLEYESVLKVGVGHSFGGVLTSLYGARDSQAFDRILLLDPILFPRHLLRWATSLRLTGLYRFNPYARKAKKRRAEWVNADAAFASLQNRGMFRGWTEEALRAYVAHAMTANEQGLWQLKCAPEREAEIFSSYATNLWQELPVLEVPTQVLVGDSTYPFVHQALEQWQQFAPDLPITQTQGGHCFMQERPADIADQIRTLLALKL
ncbi:MAG: alpha/beta hydrolase [Firmicutes bacterium]|nr:alpha/beta hydrolase [Gammaproteobacteria bacterium]MCL5049475.1 alpha/beta hydrolase [Bacillota bacterium]